EATTEDPRHDTPSNAPQSIAPTTPRAARHPADPFLSIPQKPSVRTRQKQVKSSQKPSHDGANPSAATSDDVKNAHAASKPKPGSRSPPIAQPKGRKYERVARTAPSACDKLS